jgi:xanthine dehydrogenase small subunit
MAQPARPLRFVREGRIVEVHRVAPDRTLLDWLRAPAPGGAGSTGTKEGCAEGDCGACTVVLAEPDGERLRWRAINACISMLSSIDGCALWTVDDLKGADGRLHPVQQAMVDAHASQCGFCTPGFVMSLYADYNARLADGRGAPDADEARRLLAGNLCRCTGYRPILDAARAMMGPPSCPPDEATVRTQLRAIAPDEALSTLGADDARALRPTTLDALLRTRSEHPQAQLIAGCTDIGLWVTKRHARFAVTLDVTSVRELQRVVDTGDALEIGAAVRLTQAWAAIVAHRPQLRDFADRFAGPPVRNAGTLAGNVANGSPIGDSMPVLIALGGRVRLASLRGNREVAIEDLYTGYRRNLIAPDEVIAQVIVPAPRAGETMRAYKLSKRFDDDISAVCLAIAISLTQGRVAEVRIGAGGVAAVPARARACEAVLLGRPWSEAAAHAAADALRAEFAPIGDMRATAAYRREVLGNLMLRFWHDTQGRSFNLENLDALDLEPPR